MAVGVILVFRSTRVINFAIGEMGGFAAALLYRLVIDWDVPFWLSFVTGIAVGAVVGAALELLVVRRLFSAPRVILLVALIGAAQVLLFFQLILPDVTRVRPYPTAFSGSWEIGGVLVRGPELTVIVVIPLLVIALTLFLNRTKYGLAIRASAANADAARLSGINIKKMSTIVWVIAGALAATAAMLFGPLNPQGASALGVGPGLLLRVLAAALIGGMVSMPLALAGGVAIGIAESLINYNFNDQRGLLDLVPVRRRARDVAGQWPPPRPRRSRIRAAGRSRRGSDRSPPRSRRSGGSDRCRRSASVSSRSSRCFPLVFLRPAVASARRGVACCSTRSSRSRSPCSPAGPDSSRSGSSRSSGVGGMTTAALVRDGVGLHPRAVPRGVRHGVGRHHRRRPGAAPARASTSRSRPSRSRS